MTLTFWWMLGADGLALAVLGVILVDVFVPRSRPRSKPQRRARYAVPAGAVPAHCPAPGRRTVGRTLRRRVPRTGVPGRHSPDAVPGTVAQRRISETMEFSAVPG